MGESSENLQQAKRPTTILAGPYGHPFHPILVPIPIGAWVASLVFDIGSRVSDEPEVFAKGASWLIGIGIAGALVAASIGLLDLLGIPTGTPAFRTGLLHAGLNVTAVGLFALSFALRQGDLDHPDGTAAGPLALSVVALLVLGAAGWLGGRLAYHYGVRVADEATQAGGYTTVKE
jgi:uncharacterized membrane protein